MTDLIGFGYSRLLLALPPKGRGIFKLQISSVALPFVFFLAPFYPSQDQCRCSLPGDWPGRMTPLGGVYASFPMITWRFVSRVAFAFLIHIILG